MFTLQLQHLFTKRVENGTRQGARRDEFMYLVKS